MAINYSEMMRWDFFSEMDEVELIQKCVNLENDKSKILLEVPPISLQFGTDSFV